ncbi:MAG TPA: BatA domain-containing protein [Longimicrobium sp.]|nr:BatA domain-containing protein [Longimicrobium sp.]
MGEPEARRGVITFGAPLLLLAGALAALVPLALHLIRRRPPTRAALPTARFLSEDARTSVRLSRPTDLLLLALRMLLLLLAGAALARPRWLPAPEGTSEIVLLDRGAAMAPGGGWTRAVGLARRALLTEDGTARGELVLFDTAAVRVERRRVTAALFDSLVAARPDAPRASYAAALGAILPAARELRGADSVRVTLLSRPRWSAWSDGLPLFRESTWRGAVALPDLGPAPAAGDSAAGAGDAKRAMVVGSPRAGQFAAPALEATGWSVRRADGIAPLPADSAGVYVVLAPSSPAVGAALAERARAGATVLIGRAGATAEMGSVLPWTGIGRESRPGGWMWIGGLRLSASDAARGQPKPGAIPIAFWDDGRPAAVAARVGRGCVVFAATDLEGGEMPFSAAYPRALDRLARGCDPSVGEGDAPLDAGARAVLRGSGPAALSASEIPGAGGGIPLGRWVMAVALLVAIAETVVAYRRPRTGE